jgi:hypothetical protein
MNCKIHTNLLCVDKMMILKCFLVSKVESMAGFPLLMVWLSGGFVVRLTVAVLVL